MGRWLYAESAEQGLIRSGAGNQCRQDTQEILSNEAVGSNLQKKFLSNTVSATSISYMFI